MGAIQNIVSTIANTIKSAVDGISDVVKSGLGLNNESDSQSPPAQAGNTLIDREMAMMARMQGQQQNGDDDDQQSFGGMSA